MSIDCHDSVSSCDIKEEHFELKIITHFFFSEQKTYLFNFMYDKASKYIDYKFIRK